MRPMRSMRSMRPMRPMRSMVCSYRKVKSSNLNLAFGGTWHELSLGDKGVGGIQKLTHLLPSSRETNSCA